MDPLGRSLLFLGCFIEVDEVSVAPPLLAEDSIKAGVHDVHDGLVELQELSEALGVLLPGREGEAVGGEGVVPGEGEVAMAALLLHFIYRRKTQERTSKASLKASVGHVETLRGGSLLAVLMVVVPAQHLFVLG